MDPASIPLHFPLDHLVFRELDGVAEALVAFIIVTTSEIRSHSRMKWRMKLFAQASASIGHLAPVIVT
jgi:hypothetical protein